MVNLFPQQLEQQQLKQQQLKQQQLRKEWIEALESGAYLQGNSYLHKEDGDQHFYCCLGVLCDILYPELWQIDASLSGRTTVYSLRNDTIFLSYETQKELGFPEYLADYLVAMNDTRLRSFQFIAKFLRKVWQI